MTSTFRRLAILPLLPFLAACSTSSGLPRGTPEAVGFDRTKLAAIHGDLLDLVQANKIPGAVALVARHGKVAYLDAVGLRDVDGNLPLETSSLFRICSMTKPITSVAAMMLADEGKLSL